MLATTCAPLRAAVTSSRWHPFSPFPLVAPDGTVSEPASGRFCVTCRPGEGCDGLERAFRDCPSGGSILLEEGVYHLTRPLLLARSVHVFGRGKAELRGGLAPPATAAVGELLVSRSSFATLDRVRIVNRSEGSSFTVYVKDGRLRLQGCDVSATPTNGYTMVRADGAGTSAELVGCDLHDGGWAGVSFNVGAGGCVSGCAVTGFPLKCGVFLDGAGTCPRVERCRFSGCGVGLYVFGAVDRAWEQGEGNTFEACPGGTVVDKRGAQQQQIGLQLAPGVAAALPFNVWMDIIDEDADADGFIFAAFMAVGGPAPGLLL